MFRASNGVVACQVVAVRQDVRVRPVAFFVGDGSAPREAAIVARCQGQLAARHKAPVRVFEVEAFPTGTGPNELGDLAQSLIES